MSAGFAARAKAAELEKEADKQMKKANKLLGPSILDFRFKPDWEAACPFLERAAQLYRVRCRCGKRCSFVRRRARSRATSWRCSQ